MIQAIESMGRSRGLRQILFHFCLCGLAFIGLAAGAAEISVDLIPDQPLPFVYMDDPLIVEFRSDSPLSIQARLSLKASHQETPWEKDLGSIPLSATGVRWVTVADLPKERGYYTAQVTVTEGEKSTKHSSHFCRLDRPGSALTLPLYAVADHLGVAPLLAIKGLGVKSIRLNALDEAIEERIAEARKNDLRIVLYLDAAKLKDPEKEAAALAKSFSTDIERWEIDPGKNAAMLAKLAKAMRQAGSTTPLSVITEDAEDFKAQLIAGAGQYVRESVLSAGEKTPQEVRKLQGYAEQAGYESWQIHVLGRHVRDYKDGSGPELLRHILQNFASGVSQIGFDPALIFDTELKESLVFLNGLSHSLLGSTYVGSLSTDAQVHAPVFRDQGKWFAALWSTGEAIPITLPLGKARDLRISDALNNPLPTPPLEETSCQLSIGALPIYLTGLNGAILDAAARERTPGLAQEMLDNPAFQTWLDRDFMGRLGVVAEAKTELWPRADYLALLRAFPELERQWRSGDLPRPVASPAIAQLARLARSMATAEQSRAEAFIDPISETLGDCDDYLSQYLTSSVGDSKLYERGDWLLKEVRRLMDEVEALLKAKRRTEAAAVAALANWRARGLTHVATGKSPKAIRAADFEIQAPPEPVLAPEAEEAKPEEAKPEAPEERAPEKVVEKAPEPVTPKEVVHVVARGDNLSKISKKYGVALADLMTWNKLTKRSILNIGDKLVIRGAKP